MIVSSTLPAAAYLSASATACHKPQARLFWYRFVAITMTPIVHDCKLAEGTLKTLYGDYTEHLFYDGQRETIAMVLGNVAHLEDVPVRMHSSCLYGHAFNSIECECRQEMEQAQKRIQAAGFGVIIWLEQEGKGNGHYALMQSQRHKKAGMKQADAYVAAGFEADARRFAPAAAIIKALDIKSVALLSSNEGKARQLSEQGITVNRLYWDNE